MLKKINTNFGTLYASDEPELVAKYLREKEAVLYICEDLEHAPFMDGVRYITDSYGLNDSKYLDMVCARQKHLPLTVLETERTIVREITVKDLPALYELYDDDEIGKFLEPLYEYEEEKTFTEKYIDEVYGIYGYGLWVVFDKKDGTLIGRAGIGIRNIDGKDENELGYIIKKEYRSMGYCMEICTAIIEYAWSELGFEHLYIVTEPLNVKSVRVAEKLGFVPYKKVESGKKEYLIYKRTREK